MLCARQAEQERRHAAERGRETAEAAALRELQKTKARAVEELQIAAAQLEQERAQLQVRLAGVLAAVFPCFGESLRAISIVCS